MVAEHLRIVDYLIKSCSLAKISMVAELDISGLAPLYCCSLAKISMVAELIMVIISLVIRCSLAKISMVAELRI